MISRGRDTTSIICDLGYPRSTSAWLLLRGFARTLLEYIARKACYARERRRMNAVRRDPRALRTALRSARSILIVCHGNIIRSPFTASLITRDLGGRLPVSVRSAGLEAEPGRAPHPTALLLAAGRHVDLTAHAAAPVDPGSVAQSGVILVMDIPQLVAFLQRFPEARGRTFLLSCLAPDTPLDIRDPVDGDEPVFQACFDHISLAVRPILRLLCETRPRP